MTEGAPSAAVVSVGNELLFGETVDTNAAWLGRELTTLGIPVVRRFTVGDVAEDIAVGRARGGPGVRPRDGHRGSGAHARRSHEAHRGRQMFEPPPHPRRPQVLETLKARYGAGGHDEVPVGRTGPGRGPARLNRPREPGGHCARDPPADPKTRPWSCCPVCPARVTGDRHGARCGRTSRPCARRTRNGSGTT